MPLRQLKFMQTSEQFPATAEYKECFACSYRGETADAACPKCGKKLRTSKNIRARGGIQLATGAFLVAMMIGLAGFIWWLTASAARDPQQAEKIAAQRTLFLGMYALFAVIGLFGLNGITMGVWQLAFGRRNEALIWLMFVLLAVVAAALLAVTFVLK
jgi:uncharacterized paraquat-inducible protein A